MFKKMMMVLAVLLVCLLAISAVSAETDAAGTDSSTDGVESTDEAVLGSSETDELQNDNEPSSVDTDSGKLKMGEGEVLGKDINVTGSNFTDIENAINDADDGDIIYLQGGNFTGNGSQIIIDKDLTIIGGFKEGDGIYATLDAKQLGSIFKINAPVILQGIKFINGNSYQGGAIYVNEKCTLIDCIFENNRVTDDGGAVYWNYPTAGIINCTFENNHAKYQGGANYFGVPISNVNIVGNFIENEAHNGGANWFSYELTNVTLDGNFIRNKVDYNGGANAFGRLTNVKLFGDFIGNTADNEGSANCIVDSVINNVTFTGNYINNTGNSVIYISNSASGNVIRDSIFLNNAPINVNEGSISAVDNWFGNNVTDYNVPPDTGIELDNWLFLNATVNPNPVSSVKSDVIFKLSRYDGEVSSYDNSRLYSVDLKITSTSGSVDKNLSNLNEIITYTPNTIGNGTVAASFEGTVCTIEFDTRFNPKFKIIMIDGLKLTAVLIDGAGNPIANEPVSYALDGGEAVNATTNDDGEFVCDVKSNCVLTMSYVKDNVVLCDASITLKNIKPVPKATVIEVPSTMKKTAVDYKAGEKGTMFYFYLKDADGKALANKAIKIGIFDKIYTVKTDSNGRGGLQINIANANYYTYGISFLGDDDYKASFAVCSLEIVKKSVTITPAKTSYSFKASAKTKTVTATLKSTNSYIPKGKQVTLTVAGKTFKATIGAKGQISFNIGSITKKGTYNVAIKFAGTNTYAAANSKTISIKIA